MYNLGGVIKHGRRAVLSGPRTIAEVPLPTDGDGIDARRGERDAIAGKIVRALNNNADVDQRLSVPTVHLNGTSRGELIEQLRNALTAVHDAERALELACPHGRDYYVQPGDAIGEAMRQHAARLGKLSDVERELEQIAEAILEQKGERR
jgi:hypothetical protein